MTTISDAAAQVRARPAPVLLVDTCNFLDLFRRDAQRKQPRAHHEEIQTTEELLQLMTARPDAVHLIVPELIPGEFSDHAGSIEADFESWLKFHDENQRWLAEASLSVGVAFPAPVDVHPTGLHARFRKLAEDLLGRATVLDRDQPCLERAVSRLIGKRRPSHKKEMKDSMNLEQALALSTLLHAPHPFARIFVSSNTNDFAEAATSSRLHPDLQPEFTAAGMEYSTSLRAAVGSLRARGQLP